MDTELTASNTTETLKPNSATIIIPKDEAPSGDLSDIDRAMGWTASEVAKAELEKSAPTVDEQPIYDILTGETKDRNSFTAPISPENIEVFIDTAPQPVKPPTELHLGGPGIHNIHWRNPA